MDYIIDAKQKPLGRVASEIALILQGKKHPRYDRKEEGTDRVIVKNVKDAVVTGKKMDQKIYYRHTGYVGHLKEKTFRQSYEKDPAWALRHAVRGMLPKNWIRAKRLKRLIIET